MLRLICKMICAIGYCALRQRNITRSLRFHSHKPESEGVCFQI